MEQSKRRNVKYKWTCMICGAVDIGEHPPVWCSTCKAPPSQRRQDHVPATGQASSGEIIKKDVVNEIKYEIPG